MKITSLVFVEPTRTFRDQLSIRFVHDQTVRYMNLGFTLDKAVEVVQLPTHLAESPYLRELYGKVEWSVRAVYAGNLGWFDGNPATLRPLAPRERAEHLQQLAAEPAPFATLDCCG